MNHLFYISHHQKKRSKYTEVCGAYPLIEESKIVCIVDAVHYFETIGWACSIRIPGNIEYLSAFLQNQNYEDLNR